MTLTRRQFMVGCSAAIAGMAGGRVGNLAFASGAGATSGAASDEILVMVFLRGGCDGLSLVAPYQNGIYKQKRGKGLSVENALDIAPNNSSFNDLFGLHPNASPLQQLYNDKHLAIVHACGLNDDTRSHFDAMDYIERGTPGNKNTSNGWLTRHLQSVNPDGLLSTLAASSSAPSSLLGNGNAVAINRSDSYDLNGHWRYTSNDNPAFKDAMLNSVKKFYATGSSPIQVAGRRTVETIEALKSQTLPAPGAGYTQYESFHESLKSIAQIVKLNLGLRVATVDLGGWDHHEYQGVNEGYGPFNRLTKILSDGLAAFYNDMVDYHSKLTVVVMSEFGRRLGANASSGTDHGHGGVMLVLGGNVNGGKIYGSWPGLEDLDQDQDLRITTDYRTVLSEIVVRRLGNPMLGDVFPGIMATPATPSTAATDYSFAYSPLGIVSGTDLPIDYTSASYRTYLPMVVR